MSTYCWQHGGPITEDKRSYGYLVEVGNYRLCLRCTPVMGDYQGYLLCAQAHKQYPFFSPDDQCFSVGGKFYLAQTGEEMDNPFPFSVRQGLSFSDTCAVRTRGSLMAVQQDRGSSPIELWDTGSGQLLATIDDPFVVRQVNFAFTQSGLVLHTDYGAMSIYSCAL